MVVEVEIKVPVNPEGFSFLKKVYGLLRQQGIDLKDENYKWIQQKLVKLGYKVSEAMAKEGYEFFSGKIEIDTENKKVRVREWKAYKGHNIVKEIEV